MFSLDCTGLSCPIPVVKTKKALKENPEGMDVLVDNVAAMENVSRFAEKMGYNAAVVEMDGAWKIEIRR